MAYVIEFLSLTGLLDAWIADCPLTYLSPNAPTQRDLPGTCADRSWPGTGVTPMRPPSAATGRTPAFWA